VKRCCCCFVVVIIVVAAVVNVSFKLLAVIGRDFQESFLAFNLLFFFYIIFD